MPMLTNANVVSVRTSSGLWTHIKIHSGPNSKPMKVGWVAVLKAGPLLISKNRIRIMRSDVKASCSRKHWDRF